MRARTAISAVLALTVVGGCLAAPNAHERLARAARRPLGSAVGVAVEAWVDGVGGPVPSLRAEASGVYDLANASGHLSLDYPRAGVFAHPRDAVFEPQQVSLRWPTEVDRPWTRHVRDLATQRFLLEAHTVLLEAVDPRRLTPERLLATDGALVEVLGDTQVEGVAATRFRLTRDTGIVDLWLAGDDRLLRADLRRSSDLGATVRIRIRFSDDTGQPFMAGPPDALVGDVPPLGPYEADPTFRFVPEG